MNKQPIVFSDLAEVWLEDSAPSLEVHNRRRRKAQFRNLALMTGEFVVAVSGSIAGGWLISESQWLIGVVAIAFAGLGLAVSLTTRMRLSRAIVESVSVALESTLAELNAQYRVAIGGVFVCIGALIFLAVFTFSAGYSSAETAVMREFRVIGIALLYISAALVWSAHRLWRLHRRCVQLKSAADLYKQQWGQGKVPE